MNARDTPNPPSFLSRVALAFGAFLAILGDAAFAARYQAWRSGPQSHRLRRRLLHPRQRC
jgi:hypothetical protein